MRDLSIFVEKAKTRIANEAIQKVKDTLDDGKLTPAEAWSKTSQIIMDQESSRRMVGTFKSEAEDWPTYFADLEAKQTKKEFIGLDTGFRHFNNLANGLPEGLFVVGAAPSITTSTFTAGLPIRYIPTFHGESTSTKSHLKRRFQNPNQPKRKRSRNVKAFLTWPAGLKEWISPKRERSKPI